MHAIHPLLVIATLAATAPCQLPNWTLGTPTSSPSVRRAGAMAFDGTANRLILYGGVAPTPSTILAETWSYNGQWTQLSPVGGAPARWGHRLVRDSMANRLITFGGRSPTIGAYANDTWTWNGTVWAAVPTPSSPPARALYGLSYDAARNVVVLFGGRNASQTFADTWEFNGVSWSQVVLLDSPAPREEMLMVYEASQQRTLLFGGYDSSSDTLYGDTWSYNGTAWQQLATPNAPTPRYRASSAYDSVRQRTVMYGGYDGMQVLAETFEFFADDWEQVAVGAASLQATEQYAAYDAQRHKFVTFGGVGSSFSNATYEFNGETAGTFTQFGTGCATSAGVSEITAAAPPTLGQVLNLTFTNLPPEVDIVLVALGLSNTTWQGLPLPFDLGVLGLPGCELVVSADLIQASLATAGTAQQPISIPNQPTLLNASLYVQGLLMDITATGYTFAGASRGGRARIGS